jgi:ubiquinol-cytochrome c reductase iron-sulfur subunit
MTAWALVVAIVAALGALVAAAFHANPALLGTLGAVAFFGVALAAGALAAGLHARDDLTEPRHPHGPTAPPPLPPDTMPRRTLFSSLWGLTLAAFALAGLAPVIALARRPHERETVWKRGLRLVTPDGKPLRADALEVGSVQTVFPEGNIGASESAVLLLRLEDGVMRDPPGRRDWVQNGNVAFSKVCTHAGCPVALYRRATMELYCPCHQSVFDVPAGATPVSGPATRALPQLGLDVDHEGYLIARDGFVEPVGPDEWWRPA